VKNQYFGDVNDYRKYGLLRTLTGLGEMSTAVCWMLTPDDGRTHGKFIAYLEQPEKWRHFDPDLFDKLKYLVLDRRVRDVSWAERAKILPSSHFHDELLPDDRQGRSRYFESFWHVAQDCDLVFFDPDNGMEVKSKPYGRKDSSKYLYWHELVQAFSNGYSALVYQHFPRERRASFISRMAEEMANRTRARRVYSFRTPYVVFLLLPSESQAAILERRIPRVSDTWSCQIGVHQHGGA
jgi:hypothetical protein